LQGGRQPHPIGIGELLHQSEQGGQHRRRGMDGEGSAGMSDRQQQLVAAAAQGCEELGVTIEELLDVTRIEAGQLRLNLVPVDLGAALATTRKGLEARFDDAGVRLVVDRGPTPVVVLGDPARLGSVFANVLTNALKYSPAGSVVTVRLSSGQNAQGGGTGPRKSPCPAHARAVGVRRIGQCVGRREDQRGADAGRVGDRPGTPVAVPPRGSKAVSWLRSLA
jgi:signal transduction histidine kinase